MKKRIIALAFLFSISPFVQAQNPPQLKEAKKIVKELGMSLKRHMKKAMKEGGPVHAIEFCNIEAPGITHRMSELAKWDIKRTSLKTRNSDNQPDAWEKKVLNQFEQQKKQGADPKKLEYFETVVIDGEKVFRYMKAIPTGKVCTLCHGKNIAPNIKAKLDELYPEDKARGFNVGDIRGAFTLKKSF